jgi:hypothetical protein
LRAGDLKRKSESDTKTNTSTRTNNITNNNEVDRVFDSFREGWLRKEMKKRKNDYTEKVTLRFVVQLCILFICVFKFICFKFRFFFSNLVF